MEWLGEVGGQDELHISKTSKEAISEAKRSRRAPPRNAADWLSTGEDHFMGLTFGQPNARCRVPFVWESACVEHRHSGVSSRTKRAEMGPKEPKTNQSKGLRIARKRAARPLGQ